MKITRKNYFEQIEKVDFPTLPDELKQAHVVLLVRTEKGRNWNAVTNDAELKQVADVAFEKLGEFLASGKQEKQTPAAGKKISPYYNIEKEVQLIHRFLDMHDKIIYRNTLEIFISTLQTAIKEKKIRKTSPVAGDIMKMQDAAIRMYNTMDSATHVVLKSETIKKLKGILVKYENALDAEERPTREKPKAKRVSLEGTPASKGKLMNSTDFVKLSFQRIGFTGKWLDLMGDPAPGFTAMVFGKPKFGKSFLCIEWAGYLARNHGKVLYAAKEEGLDATLQDKLKGKEVQHPNLTVSDYIPADLSAYDFIFLDSVNKFGLSPEDLEKLKKANPGKSFIYIFQSTKEGKFRGTNEYQHDVDVVIEVPEKGKAVQFGRFNQGGQMDIFGKGIQAEETLEGVQKKKQNQDWTDQEWLTEADRVLLKRIKRLCENGDMRGAMQVAMDADTVIREAIPGDLWKKMGGTLTPTGEERLRKQKQKVRKPTSKPRERIYLPYTFEVVELKSIYTKEMGDQAPDIGFEEILADAVEANEELPGLIKELGKSLHTILPMLYRAAEKRKANSLNGTESSLAA